MKWEKVNNALTLKAVLVIVLIVPTSGAACPSVCACKWKGGKQTVECLQKALITIPQDIDTETQVLDMSENNLQIIPREAFYKTNLTNLQKVFLKGCRIGQIGDRAFRGLTNLVELDLSRNLLTAVPSATFEDTPFLRYLSLADNPIQKVESNAFRMVSGMSKIDLSHCEIQNISPNAFDKLESLEWLKLNGNKLTELDPRTVDTISKLHGIELHDNPWYCDCKLRSAKEWLSRNKIPYVVAPACRGPERVEGRTFEELGVDDFACRPEILPVSRYVEATTGENATIICRVGAVPPANVHWYWNGRLLLNNSAFSAYQTILIFEEGKFEKSSLLVLTNALETDSGEFYCVAENRAGTAEGNFTLHVSLRTAGMSSLGSGQIAGLSAAFATLILSIIVIALVLFMRFRRIPFSQSKTNGQLEVIATLKGNGITTCTKPKPNTSICSAERKSISETNTAVKPPEVTETLTSGAYELVQKSACDTTNIRLAGNNPDIIRDAEVEGANLEGQRMSLNPKFPSPAWESSSAVRSFPKCIDTAYNQGEFNTSDKTPIISENDSQCRNSARSYSNYYPPDYGLPIFDEEFNEYGPGPSPSSGAIGAGYPSAVTSRVWQRGVPVLPPATATMIKRVLPTSRNSPDEGYQEGCGTDV